MDNVNILGIFRAKFKRFEKYMKVMKMFLLLNFIFFYEQYT